MRASAYSFEASWTKPAWRMSGCFSTAAMASARWAAAWVDSSSAVSNCSRWTARIDAAQAWIVLRHAARVISRALCLLSNTPRAQSPPAWISSSFVTSSAYGGGGPRVRASRSRSSCCRSSREVADLDPALPGQLLQAPEAGQVGGQTRHDHAVGGPYP